MKNGPSLESALSSAYEAATIAIGARCAALETRVSMAESECAELRAALAGVRTLIHDKWPADWATYPATYEGNIMAVTVRECQREVMQTIGAPTLAEK